jgi:fermentation-respiration switch protein FrsA (DUF1100 family)
LNANNSANFTVFDRPEILRYLFYPRPEWNMSFSANGYTPLAIPVDKDVVVGAAFHESSPTAPNILFFHGNGEIVSDYNEIAPFYTDRGLNFIPVDYRGYGRSTGTPSVGALMKDSHTIFAYLKDWLKNNGYTGPFILMGRSLGSAPALELAKHYHDEVDGLIIESGFAHIEPLLALMGLDMRMLGIENDPVFQNLEKVSEFRKPTLVIHSQYDHIIVPAEGRALYEASPARQKRLLMIAGANHNNIFMAGMGEYMNAVTWLAGLFENGDE